MSEISKIPKDLSGNLGLLIGQMKLTRLKLQSEVKDIDQDMLDYSPDIDLFETIGTFLFHIADVENSWIFEHLENQKLDFEKWKYAYPLRLELEPRQMTGRSLQFYMDTLQEVRENVLEQLEKYGTEESERVFESKLGSTTLEWVLYHIQRHENHHIGQINILKRLYKSNKC